MLFVNEMYLQSLFFPKSKSRDKDTFFFLDFFFFSGDVLVVLSIDAMEGVLTDGGIDSLELDPDPT